MHTYTCAHVHMRVHVLEHVGGKQSVSVPCLLPFGAREERLGKSEVSKSRGPAFPVLHCQGPITVCLCSTLSFPLPAAGQPCTAPAHGVFSASCCLRRCGKSPLLHHAPSWTTAWHTSPSPQGSPPALLTLLHLTPIFFCLLFSLSITYGCFCSAPRRHRERAQLPLL